MKSENNKNYSKKGKVIFIIIAFLVLFFFGSGVVKSFSHNGSKVKTKTASFRQVKGVFGNDTKVKKNHSFKKAYIAQITIKGVITSANDTYNQRWLLETIENLKNDENNKGIILFIDSPGGGVYQADEVYLALLDYKKEKGSPIYSYFGPLAASGGYYIACASDYIMANRNTLTGSIGVISGQFTDLTGLMEKFGIKITTVHSGKNKIMGSIAEPMTEEQREIMQEISDECYEQFTSIVSESRSIPKEQVIELSDGRIYTAQQAEKNGLIDSIGSMNDLIDAMKRKEFDFEDYDVKDFYYQKDVTLYDFIMGSSHLFKKDTSFLPSEIKEKLASDIEFPSYFYSPTLFN